MAVAQEITPLLAANASVIANLGDPSALPATGGSWSIADEADLLFGGCCGVGEPATSGAEAITPHSEFGLYPRVAWVSARVYF